MRTSAPSTAALLLLLLSFVALVAAWTKEDYEIFRLRDEVELNEGEGVTFYDFIGVKKGQSATADEINKSYRRTSLRIHPDKHKPAPHLSPAAKRRSHKKASERFTRLGLVANILRGPERDRYDHFLRNGFPKWRGTGYYYARFRPGLGSVLTGILFVAGIVHYGILALDARQKKRFMESYIREARTAAWGKDAAIPGLPTAAETGMMDIGAAPSATTTGTDDAAPQAPMNRKERRANEKKNKKSGTATPTTDSNASPAPASTDRSGGARRKIVAPNGKQFIVDASGQVFLLAEGEDGPEELLLDINEIEGPKWSNTLWFTLPRFFWRITVGKVLGKKQVDGEGEDDDDEESGDGDAGDSGDAEERARKGRERAERRKRVQARRGGRK